MAQKSSYIMQMLADVLQRPIAVAASEQAPALGAAMYAAVAAGCYPTVEAAQQAMSSGFSATYRPQPTRATYYDQRYAEYLQLGHFVEDNAAQEAISAGS